VEKGEKGKEGGEKKRGGPPQCIALKTTVYALLAHISEEKKRERVSSRKRTEMMCDGSWQGRGGGGGGGDGSRSWRVETLAARLTSLLKKRGGGKKGEKKKERSVQSHISASDSYPSPLRKKDRVLFRTHPSASSNPSDPHLPGKGEGGRNGRRKNAHWRSAYYLFYLLLQQKEKKRKKKREEGKSIRPRPRSSLLPLCREEEGGKGERQSRVLAYQSDGLLPYISAPASLFQKEEERKRIRE